ncbi:isopropylmalate/homocitrate/citramalate synthase [Bradyrhizobium sp. LB14.3]
MKRVVAYARNKGLAVGGEDSSRADVNFLTDLIAIANVAGVRRFRVADTLSVLDPDASFALLAALRASTDLELEFHGHDDLGLATANTLAPIKAGATHASVTAIGLRQRARNAPLEEVAVALRQLYGRDTGVLLSELEKLAAAAAAAACRNIPPSKAVVGEHVFTHEFCIHVDGLLKDRPHYQALDPGLLGRSPALWSASIQALPLSLRSCPSYSFRSPPSKPKPFSRASASMPSSTKARFPRKRWWRSGATFTKDRSSTEGYQVVSHARRAIRLEHSSQDGFWTRI